jgi:hypothetical protein
LIMKAPIRDLHPGTSSPTVRWRPGRCRAERARPPLLVGSLPQAAGWRWPRCWTLQRPLRALLREEVP